MQAPPAALTVLQGLTLVEQVRDFEDIAVAISILWGHTYAKSALMIIYRCTNYTLLKYMAIFFSYLVFKQDLPVVLAVQQAHSRVQKVHIVASHISICA